MEIRITDDMHLMKGLKQLKNILKLGANLKNFKLSITMKAKIYQNDVITIKDGFFQNDMKVNAIYIDYFNHWDNKDGCMDKMVDIIPNLIEEK